MEAHRPETQKDIVAKAAIFCSTGTFLAIVRHPDDKHRGGELDLAGGGVESSESMREAVYRETYEEVGLRLECLSQQPVFGRATQNMRRVFS